MTAFLIAFTLFLLSTRHLLTVYVWLSSIGVILWSYICNEEYNKYVFSIRRSTLAYELISFNFNAIFRFIANYIFQVLFSTLLVRTNANLCVWRYSSQYVFALRAKLHKILYRRDWLESLSSLQTLYHWFRSYLPLFWPSLLSSRLW